MKFLNNLLPKLVDHGSIHEKLGGNRIFKCPNCKMEIGRDFNGARNIFMMNVEEYVGQLILEDH